MYDSWMLSYTLRMPCVRSFISSIWKLHYLPFFFLKKNIARSCCGSMVVGYAWVVNTPINQYNNIIIIRFRKRLKKKKRPPNPSPGLLQLRIAAKRTRKNILSWVAAREKASHPKVLKLPFTGRNENEETRKTRKTWWWWLLLLLWSWIVVFFFFFY